MSKKELAEACMVDVSIIEALEKRRYTVQAICLFKLAAYFKLNVDDIFADINEKHRINPNTNKSTVTIPE